MHVKRLAKKLDISVGAVREHLKLMAAQPKRERQAARTAVDGFELTDTGNAKRLAQAGDGKVHYVEAYAKFLIYRGGVWAYQESRSMVRALAAHMIAKQLAAAREAGNEDLVRYWQQCEGRTSRWSLFFDWCSRQGKMAGPNPCDAIKLDPKPVSQNDGDLIIHLHETEANELLDWKELTAMQRAAYSLGILGGLRPGEIFALRWQDVRFDTHQIEVRRSWNRAVKNKNARRDIPMLPKLEEALRAYRELQRTTRIGGLGGCP